MSNGKQLQQSGECENEVNLNQFELDNLTSTLDDVRIHPSPHVAMITTL